MKGCLVGDFSSSLSSGMQVFICVQESPLESTASVVDTHSPRLLCASQMSSLCGCAVLSLSLIKAQNREIRKGSSQTSPARCTLKP